MRASVFTTLSFAVTVFAAGRHLIQVKDGAASATLSMACAGARLTGELLRALRGEPALRRRGHRLLLVQRLGRGRCSPGMFADWFAPSDLLRFSSPTVMRRSHLLARCRRRRRSCSRRPYLSSRRTSRRASSCSSPRRPRSYYIRVHVYRCDTA